MLQIRLTPQPNHVTYIYQHVNSIMFGWNLLYNLEVYKSLLKTTSRGHNISIGKKCCGEVHKSQENQYSTEQERKAFLKYFFLNEDLTY